jgi:monoamine oxidase
VARLTAGNFDDGRTDVPAGLAGPTERVVVVGAGIAGLTVANALAHGGVECVVVEARDRVGGRLHTVDLGGSPVDLGGSWIHTPVGNPMRAFAQQAGIPCRSANPMSELAGFDCGEGRRLSAAEVEASLSLQFEAFPEAVGRLRDELGPDATAAYGIETFVAGAGLAPGPARRARQALRALVEAESADLAERQSLRWMWNEIEYGGHYLGDVPDGGYRRLVEAMAAGVDVRLGVDVAEVVLSAGGVRVRSADGTSEEGSHVVVAVPRPAPAAVAVTSWASDPRSGGAYTHIPPGASPADADLLGEPVGGRLLFAGEHTQSARMAYADGAMTSGIREAKRLLSQPGVRLGPVIAGPHQV